MPRVISSSIRPLITTKTSVFIAVISVFILSASALAISRGYNSDDTGLSPGYTVAISDADNNTGTPKVERASIENLEKVIGVATKANDNLVTIGSEGKTVYVQTDGEVKAFVADLDGVVKQGDLLTLSPIKGVLTKASTNLPAIAIALQDFSAVTPEQILIQDQNGNRNTSIAKISVNLDQKSLASLALQGQDTLLKRLGINLVGREVAELRIIIGLVIFFIVLIAEGGIIYGAVSSAIKSLGRNPLARAIIKKELVRVLFVALAVLGIGVLAIYAVIWV